MKTESLYPNKKYIACDRSVDRLLTLLYMLGFTIPLDTHGYVHRVTGIDYYTAEIEEVI